MAYINERKVFDFLTDKTGEIIRQLNDLIKEKPSYIEYITLYASTCDDHIILSNLYRIIDNSKDTLWVMQTRLRNFDSIWGNYTPKYKKEDINTLNFKMRITVREKQHELTLLVQQTQDVKLKELICKVMDLYELIHEFTKYVHTYVTS